MAKIYDFESRALMFRCSGCKQWLQQKDKATSTLCLRCKELRDDSYLEAKRQEREQKEEERVLRSMEREFKRRLQFSDD